MSRVRNVGVADLRRDGGAGRRSPLRAVDRARGRLVARGPGCGGRPHGARSARPGRRPVDVVPRDFNVRTSVHEYGGGAYCVHDGIAFVSRLRRPAPVPRRLRPRAGADHARGAGATSSLRRRSRDPRRRPLDRRSRAARGERHSQDVVNELVAVPTDGSAEPRVVAERPRLLLEPTHLAGRLRDSASSPGISRGCRGTAASCTSPISRRDGEVTNVRARRRRRRRGVDLAAGVEPERRPRVRERSLRLVESRAHPRRRARAAPSADAEFGYPAWVFGARSFAFLDDGRIVCGYENAGFTRFGAARPRVRRARASSTSGSTRGDRRTCGRRGRAP